MMLERAIIIYRVLDLLFYESLENVLNLVQNTLDS